MPEAKDILSRICGPSGPPTRWGPAHPQGLGRCRQVEVGGRRARSQPPKFPLPDCVGCCPPVATRGAGEDQRQVHRLRKVVLRESGDPTIRLMKARWAGPESTHSGHPPATHTHSTHNCGEGPPRHRGSCCPGMVWLQTIVVRHGRDRPGGPGPALCLVLSSHCVALTRAELLPHQLPRPPRSAALW